MRKQTNIFIHGYYTKSSHFIKNRDASFIYLSNWPWETFQNLEKVTTQKWVENLDNIEWLSEADVEAWMKIVDKALINIPEWNDWLKDKLKLLHDKVWDVAKLAEISRGLVELAWEVKELLIQSPENSSKKWQDWIKEKNKDELDSINNETLSNLSKYFWWVDFSKLNNSLHESFWITLIPALKNYQKIIETDLKSLSPNIIAKIKKSIAIKVWALPSLVQEKTTTELKEYWNTNNLKDERWNVSSRLNEELDFINNRLLPSAQFLVKLNSWEVETKKKELKSNNWDQSFIDNKINKLTKEIKQMFDSEVDEEWNFNEWFFSTQSILDLNTLFEWTWEVFAKEHLWIKPVEITFLNEADKEIENKAMMWYMWACVFQMLPYAWATMSIPVDAMDAFSSEEWTITYLKWLWLVDPKFRMEKLWVDNAFWAVWLVATVVWLQWLVKSWKLAKAMDKIGGIWKMDIWEMLKTLWTKMWMTSEDIKKAESIVAWGDWSEDIARKWADWLDAIKADEAEKKSWISKEQLSKNSKRWNKNPELRYEDANQFLKEKWLKELTSEQLNIVKHVHENISKGIFKNDWATIRKMRSELRKAWIDWDQIRVLMENWVTWIFEFFSKANKHRLEIWKEYYLRNSKSLPIELWEWRSMKIWFWEEIFNLEKHDWKFILSWPWGMVWEINWKTIVWRRAPEWHLQINNDSVSGRHATLEISWGKIIIEDHNSTNWTQFLVTEWLRSIKNSDTIWNLPPLQARRVDRATSIENVKRETEVLAVWDLHWNYNIFIANLKSLWAIDWQWNWTWWNRRLVLHWDIMADRNTSWIKIMEKISDLQQNARKEWWDISVISWNHDDFAISYLTGKETAWWESDWFTNSLWYPWELRWNEFEQFLQQWEFQWKWLEEFWQRFWQKYWKENLWRWEWNTDEVRNEVLKNMRSTNEWRRILESISNMKILEQIDDTLFVHTDLTPAMAEMILSKGVDQINSIYQKSLRNMLLDWWSPHQDYREVINIFLSTENRQVKGWWPGYFNYQQWNQLKKWWINSVIHWHSKWTWRSENIWWVYIWSIDSWAWKGWLVGNDRSIARIKKDGDIVTFEDAAISRSINPNSSNHVESGVSWIEKQDVFRIRDSVNFNNLKNWEKVELFLWWDVNYLILKKIDWWFLIKDKEWKWNESMESWEFFCWRNSKNNEAVFNDDSVSWQHARVTISWDNLTISDLSSTNWTYYRVLR